MSKDKVDKCIYDCLIDVYNKRVRKDNLCGTLATHPQDGHSGTFWALEVYKLKDIKWLGNVCPTKNRDNPNQGRVYSPLGLCPSLNCCGGGNRQPMVLEVKEVNEQKLDPKWIFEVNGEKYYIRIRKLTPKECFRLMGFNDEEFKRAEQVNSNTQLYKEAGNSIVVDVLEAIFGELFKDEIKELRNEQR